MGCAWGSNTNHRVAPGKEPIAQVKTTEVSSTAPRTVQHVESSRVFCCGPDSTDDRERLTTSNSEGVEVVRNDSLCCCPQPVPPPPIKRRPLTVKEISFESIIPAEMIDQGTQMETIVERSCFEARSFSPNNHQARVIQQYQMDYSGTLDSAFDFLNDEERQPIIDSIEKAKENCTKSYAHGLKTDESAALYLYSMRDSSDSVYDRLHKALESDEESEIQKWMKFLTLLKNAWEKLPLISNEVWQGIAYDEELVEKLRSSSDEDFFTCIGSCTPLTKVIKDHLKQPNKSERILIFGYVGVCAKDITPYIAGNQSEIMLWPGKRINQIKIDENSSVVTVHLSYEPEQFHIQIIDENSHETTLISTPTSKTEESIRSTRSTLPIVHEDTIMSSSTATMSIQPVLPAPITPRIGHFNCPNKICVNACDGCHSGTHCRGIAHLNHHCNHHCGSGYRCYLCKKHSKKLYECTSCHWRFCESCSF